MDMRLVWQPFCTGDIDSSEPAPAPGMPPLGMTSLHLACRCGDVQLATRLIAAKADPSIRDDHWLDLTPRAQCRDSSRVQVARLISTLPLCFPSVLSRLLPS